MGDFKINEKSVFTQSGSAEPVLASNVTGGSGLTLGGPAGMIAPFAMASPPTGWLACDGSSLLRAGTYAPLFTAISTTWGSADGTHFNVPDLEGAFLRGVGTSTVFTVDSTIALAAVQNDQSQGHGHEVQAGTDAAGGALYNATSGSVAGKAYTTNIQTFSTYGTPRYGNETRPNNIGVKYCIKY